MEIINLDMTPSTVTPNAHAGQYDSARTVRFMLKNGGVPFTLAGTETITAEITRSDNTEVTVNVANTSSNYVDVVFDDTVCTVKGLYACELRLKDSDGFDIGSKNFALLVQRDPYDGKNVRIVTVGPADICTFETTLLEPLQSVLVNVEATGGYDADTQTAHPINGYTEANIIRCGVNIWDEEWELGIYSWGGTKSPDNSRIRCKNLIPCSPSTTYYVATSGNLQFFYYDENQGFITFEQNSVKNRTITTPANCAYIAFYVYSFDYGTTYNNDISINYPSTDTTYHPYTGNTYTIAFGQTVYGGVLDVTRGKLHVTHLLNTYLGSADENWQKAGSVGNSQRFYIENQGEIKSINSAISNYLTPTDTFDHAFGTFRFATNQTLIVHDNAGDFSDVASFKAYLSSHNLQICYELATPFDIDLTPEVISAVVGTNNVFADCGQTTVKYLEVE